MVMSKIETEEQFNELLKEDTFLLFKHSVTCPVSAEAFEQYERYILGNEQLITAYLAVQEARPLSNYVAETFDVKHQSPQAILFKGGKPVWNESHWRITYDSLSKAITE
ncbi:bacillithiol system redox-active protein YtxJ [Peribacillus frigoritolerans]|uniref:bacillithiol system redox-active protein YtxJ n=1 Tax=Peribacillus frigoritolerans TaxID=450367 RepID=UPI00300A998F